MKEKEKMLTVPSVEYGLLKADEIRQCANMAADAFQQYEYFTTFFPDADERRRFLHRSILSDTRSNYGLAHYLIGHREGEIVASAQLQPPNYRKPSTLRYLMHGWLGVMLLPHQSIINDWLKMDEEAGQVCHHLMDGETWYVGVVTINSRYQGQGLGTDLFQHGIFPYVRQQGGKRITLFTNSESNLRFYNRLGFKLVDKRDINYKGQTMGSWSLICELDELKFNK